MDESGWNMWIFRDGRKPVRGEWLIEGLCDSLLRSSVDTLSALLWAGEMECALSDSSSPDELLAKKVTDELAYALLTGALPRTKALLNEIRKIAMPAEVRVSVAESFAYYALHPLSFAKTAAQVAKSGSVRVVGIRSIGITLSAMAAAGLRAKGLDVARMTVRPTGHPYDRELALTEEQRRWVADALDAEFLVVDEGPGLSGSSFLATAEALEAAGVAKERITLIGTSKPVPEHLRATDGAERWRRLRAEFVSGEPMLPEGASLWIGGGEWRSHFLRGAKVPGAWLQLEARKYLSADRKRFFRFEGFGRYGTEVGERALRMAELGFSPKYLGNMQGFGCYEFMEGTAMTSDAVSDELIHRLASYCAMRAQEFATGAEPGSENENMLRHNWKTIFGTELGKETRLEIVRPVIADGRMLPHEWMRAGDGVIYKVDGTTHGDDHFAPGPCDIAWDLAGVIVEWELGEEARENFVAEYERLSGDDARPRLGAYLLAYATFRCAYSKMAAQAMGGTEEEMRLQRDYARYREEIKIHHGDTETQRKARRAEGAVVGESRSVA